MNKPRKKTGGKPRKRLQLKAEVSALLEEAGRPNWNGEGAVPLDARTLDMVNELIDSLPGDLDDPAVFPMPSGKICLAWVLSVELMLFVHIRFDAPASFLAIIGDDIVKDSAPWENNTDEVLRACSERIQALRNKHLAP